MDINSKILIIDAAPTDCILIAPKEFIALIVNYCTAIDSKDIIQAKLLMDNWLSKDNNAKSLSIIKNIGVKE